jgi:hypothetical protein
MPKQMQQSIVVVSACCIRESLCIPVIAGPVTAAAVSGCDSSNASYNTGSTVQCRII